MSRLTLSILFVAICIPVLGIAQTSSQTPPASAPAAIGPAKIAWVNLDQVLMTCSDGRAIVAEIQKFVDEKQKEMDSMRNESEKLRNNLSVQGSKLTDEARADLEEQVEARETGAQRFQQDTQKEIENRRARMTNYIVKRLQPVIEKLAKEKGLSAVLVLNQGRDAFVDPSLVLTEEIVKAYDQTYPAGGKAPAAAAPKK
jgi:outer membrane protein